ncbi:hypothetical protein HWV62_37747 [Athelia sp. TMB]|nr:hypothetical protein HWV62_37747 [Athelia sp. TMB]
MANTANADRTLRKQRTAEYPIQMWYFLACFIALVGALRLASRLWSLSTRQKRAYSADSESQGSTSGSRINLRRLPVAVLNTYRIIALRWTVRVNLGTVYTLNMADVAVTCAYIIAVFTWTFINTTTLAGQKFNLIYWTNRAGAIAASQFPLVTALGTKNNVIALITGIGYDKLNYAHRMTSRVLFVLIWAHVGGELMRGGYEAADWASIWLRTGFLAVISLTALMLVSLRPVRAKAYELFFWVHFVTVLVQTYIWPCFVIWGFDRLVRGLRVLLFAATSPPTPTPGPDAEKHQHHIPSAAASARLEPVSPSLVRLTLPRPRLFHWAAGQSVFLTVPGLSKFSHEAHPFTIASVEGDGTQDELVFFIDVRSGFTKRLATHALSNKDAPMSAKVYVDGPYGSVPDMRSFDVCILLAGGSGVSYTLALLLDAMRHAAKKATACQRIVFVWATRDIQNISLIKPALVKSFSTQSHGLSVDIRIHNTGPPRAIGSEEYLEKSAASSSTSVQDTAISHTDTLGALPGVTIRDGRPDIAAIIREEAQAVRGGRMGVAVCGSDSMVQSSRSALGLETSGIGAVLKGGASVSLFIEGFGYA